MFDSWDGKTTIPSRDRNVDSDGDSSGIRHHNVSVRPMSDVVGSALYVSQPLTFSQLYLQSDEEPMMYPLEPALGSPVTLASRQNLQRSIRAGGRGSVVRVIGSQLVTVLRDDQTTIRRSTLSAIARQFTEQKSTWMDGEHPEVDLVDEDKEEREKQREHRSKAEKVLALLRLEQEKLEREEQEEGGLSEKSGETKLNDEESVRRERVKARICLELDKVAAENDTEHNEGEEEEGWHFDQDSITSSRWTWDEMSDRAHQYRVEMRDLVSKFKEAEAKVWKEIIDRYKPSSLSDTNTTGSSNDLGREPFASLTNSQLRGNRYEILCLQAKRQRQLDECIEVQSQW
ncbi:hypothetical protein EV361DRAFT_907083 [Lentinula raphanica]|nr:hypothetical protein EV361DRAFT_907083 [Lentinula raphanica]